MGEEEKSFLSQFQAKKIEENNNNNWESQLLLQQQQQHQPQNGINSVVDVKQENSPNNYLYVHGTKEDNFQAPKPTTWTSSPPNSSPCVSSFSSNMLDFSNTTNKADGRHPPPDRSSSECNSSSTATGGALKKARVQPSSPQPTFKVRKEKLGDRITALHQLVSPFGKTDTASVLLEAIGYIRFLQCQIEALSLPYLGSGSAANMRPQHSVQGDGNCIFPEDPGQLLNDNCMKRQGSTSHLHHATHEEEQKKDLRSRGLCLVPVSCTSQVGSDNGADYWAPAALGGGVAGSR